MKWNNHASMSLSFFFLFFNASHAFSWSERITDNHSPHFVVYFFDFMRLGSKSKEPFHLIIIKLHLNILKKLGW
ncbi:hypothetical protein ACJW30_02G006500 [Castanea mollissima]